MRVVFVFVFLLLGSAAPQAQPASPIYGEPTDFYGTWNNVEIERNIVVRIEVRPDYGRHVRVTVYGLHNGEPCIFGDYRGAFFLAKYQKPREEDNSAILVKVDRDFVHGHILLRFNPRGEIVSHALLEYYDRGPVYSVERFSYHRHVEEGYSRPPYGPAPYYRGY